MDLQRGIKWYLLRWMVNGILNTEYTASSFFFFFQALLLLLGMVSTLVKGWWDDGESWMICLPPPPVETLPRDEPQVVDQGPNPPPGRASFRASSGLHRLSGFRVGGRVGVFSRLIDLPVACNCLHWKCLKLEKVFASWCNCLRNVRKVKNDAKVANKQTSVILEG